MKLIAWKNISSVACVISCVIVLAQEVYAEKESAKKTPTGVYRCLRDEVSPPFYTSNPMQGVKCELFSTTKAALKKVSNEKFDKMSRARISRLASKNPAASETGTKKAKPKTAGKRNKKAPAQPSGEVVSAE